MADQAGELTPVPPENLDLLLHKLFAIRHENQTINAEIINVAHPQGSSEPEVTLRIRGNNQTIRYL